MGLSPLFGADIVGLRSDQTSQLGDQMSTVGTLWRTGYDVTPGCADIVANHAAQAQRFLAAHCEHSATLCRSREPRSTPWRRRCRCTPT